MVYCRLQSKTDKYISYSIGARYGDITGEVRIDPDGMGYEIIKQPVKENVYPHFIDRMLIRYTNQFQKGMIPEKMSYEI